MEKRKEETEEEVEVELESECDLCGGTGLVEKVEYECNDSTGYNTIAMPTGEMEECPECGGLLDHDDQDE